MKTILVPLDGTPAAEAALAHSCGLASRYQAGLLLTTVADPSSEVAWAQWERLKTLGQKLDARTRFLSGNPAQAILREAHYTRPDLIVMATHGQPAVSRWMPGSVAERLLRDAPCPVLVVRQPEQSSAQADDLVRAASRGDYPRYRRILVPLDGAPASERSLGPACRLSQDDAASLTLVRVLDGLEMSEAHREYLEDRATRLRAQGCKVETRYCHGALCDKVGGPEQDLIVLTDRRGQVVEPVLHRAECPVLVLREQGSPLFGELPDLSYSGT